MPFDPDAFLAEPDAAPAAGFDPDAFVAAPDVKDVGPTARRAASGLAPGPRPPAQEPVTIERRTPFLRGGKVIAVPESEVAARAKRDTEADAFHNDPLAQGIAAGIVGQGAGALAGAVAEPLAALSPHIPTVIAGATSGAVSSKVLGGSAATGAIVGGLSGFMQSVTGKAAAKLEPNPATAEKAGERTATGFIRAGTKPQKEELLAIGKRDIADVAQRHGLGKIENAQNAEQALGKAVADTGKEIGGAYEAAAATGVSRPVPIRGAATIFTDLKKKYASLGGTQSLLPAVERFERDFMAAHGNKGKITPREIHAEISRLNDKGFAGTGVELSQENAKVVARDLAMALRKPLDEMLEEASKKSPIAKAAIDRLPRLNRDFEVLKTMEPVVRSASTAQQTALRFVDRLRAQPIDALKQAGGTAAALLPRAAISAAQLPGRAADIALARLFAARAGGQTITPDLLAAASAAGVSPQMVQQFQRPAPAPMAAPQGTVAAR